MSTDRFCKKYMKVAWNVTGHRTAVFTRLRCKQWSCEFCATRNAWLWREHLKQRLPEISGEWWLITFTANENTRTRAQSMANIRDHLDRLFKRVRRVFGAIEYVRVYERHPTSEAVHAHLIMSGIAPYVALGYSAKLKPMAIGVLNRNARNGIWSVKTWFKINARECKMGYMVDVQLIDGEPERAIWYVTKYLTKSLQDLHEKGLRHVQTTKGIGSPELEKQSGWETGAYITTYTFEAGTKVIDLNTGFVIDNDFWEIKGFYPDDQ